MSSEPNSPRYRNDNWSLEDGFGLGRAGDQVARMALEVDPPFTIGVTGKWGAGKTSVMRRAFVTLGGRPLHQALPLSADGGSEAESEDWALWEVRGEKRAESLGWPQPTLDIATRALCVWYSPWQHQNEDNPLVPMIREIQAQFTVWLKFKDKTKAINRQAGLAGAKLLEHVADAAASLYAGRQVRVAHGLTDTLRSAWQEGDERLTALSDGQRFHLLFEDAVKELLKAGGDDAGTPVRRSTLGS